METILMRKSVYISCFLPPVHFKLHIIPFNGKLDVTLDFSIPSELSGIELPEDFIGNRSWLAGKLIKDQNVGRSVSSFDEAFNFSSYVEKKIMSLVTSGANALLVAQIEEESFTKRMKSLGWKLVK